jgi:hypothetical protein
MGDLAFLNIMPDEQTKPTSFDPLPAGVYTCVIEDAEVKRNKALTGSFLSLKLQVIDGPHNGRLVFDNITVDHETSDKAVAIGREKIVGLARICNASGADSQEFVGKVVSVKVKIDAAKDGYDAQNRVVAYAAPAASPAARPVSAALSSPEITKRTTITSGAATNDEPPF